MRARIGRRSVLLLIAGLLAGLGIGGGVAATLAQPSPATIRACVANNTGSVRLVAANANCYANEHVVVWAANGTAGPPGPQGPPGTPGAQGIQGLPGPSDAWVTTNTQSINLYFTGIGAGVPSTVVAWTVTQAGSYLVTGVAPIDNQFQQADQASPSNMRCHLFVNGVDLVESGDQVNFNQAHAALALIAGDVVSLVCSQEAAMSVPPTIPFDIQNATITATLVGALHQTTYSSP